MPAPAKELALELERSLRVAGSPGQLALVAGALGTCSRPPVVVAALESGIAVAVVVGQM